MSDKAHTLIVEILPDGSIKSTVKGVKGKKCTELSAWIDKLGEVVVDRHTEDFGKGSEQTVSVHTSN